MAMVQIEVTKNKNESTASLLRRFTTKSKGSGLVKKAKSLRFNTRAKSTFVKKKEALKKISKRQEMEKLYKLGKVRNVYGKKRR